MTFQRIAVATAMAAVVLAAPATARAHCDGLDGPVVKAAQAALESGDVARVLIWVRAEDEPEIRAAFDDALAVRRLSAQAKTLADRYFFETVVRIHRVGEGAPYTGLQPAGRDLGPAIPAADAALASGSPDRLVALLNDATTRGVRRHFEEALEAGTFAPEDVEAGRGYVRAYVEFIHYVERLFEAIETSTHGHYNQGGGLR